MSRLCAVSRDGSSYENDDTLNCSKK